MLSTILKKLIEKTLLLILFSFFMNAYAQNQIKKDTLYFDENWKPTTKSNYEFYRPLPLNKIGDLSLIKDFYKNGTMQMQGYVYTDSLDVLVGDIYWYDKKGFDYSFEQFLNLTNETLVYYHNNGSVWKTIEYKNDVKEGVVKVYNNKRELIFSEEFKKGINSTNQLNKFSNRSYSNRQELTRSKANNFNRAVLKLKNYKKSIYWMHTGALAKCIEYENDQIIRDITYSEKGEILKQFNKDDFLDNELKNGIYNTFKTKNGFAIALDSLKYDTQKSKIIKINDIDYLEAYNSGELSFYREQSPNKFSEVDYDFIYDEDNLEKLFKVYPVEEEYYTTEKIKKNGVINIDVDNIKTQSIESLLKQVSNKEWSNDYYEVDRYSKKDSTAYKVVFKQFNSEIFIASNLKYTKKQSRGFGSSYSNSDDDIKKWRLNSSDFFSVNILVLNDNKPILVLTEGDSMEYYIIPTINEGLVVNYKEEGAREGIKINNSESVLKSLLYRTPSKEFYKEKSEGDKKYIANLSDETLIKTAFDSISFKGNYIIGYHNREIEIYNPKLDKLNLSNIRSVYYDRGNLQVLTNNHLKYIDVLGKESKRIYLNYLFCGTVHSTSFELFKPQKRKNFNALVITKGGFASRETTKKVLFFDNLNDKYDLKFLNKTTFDEFDDNSSFVDDYVNYTHLFTVSDGKKTGLFTYNYDINFQDKIDFYSQYSENDYKIKIPDDLYVSIDKIEYAITKAEQVLPITYDFIELKSGLIVVNKEGVLGIYPLKEGFKYKSIGKKEGNFISYEDIYGKKGWIDIHTHKEYAYE